MYTIVEPKGANMMYQEIDGEVYYVAIVMCMMRSTLRLTNHDLLYFYVHMNTQPAFWNLNRSVP